MQLIQLYKRGEPMLVAPNMVAELLKSKDWSDTPPKKATKAKSAKDSEE